MSIKGSECDNEDRLKGLDERSLSTVVLERGGTWDYSAREGMALR